MLRLPDSWTWDFWLADTGSEYHVFFLRASRALRHPDRRHHRASIGHAVSPDLRDWTVVADALVPADEPSWDDRATWTGSVVQGPDGVWRMFYTGLSRAERGTVQRIGVATSTDLINWDPSPTPLVEADPRWYDVAADGVFPEQYWRDPWVFADPAGAGWHMLITAHGRTGPVDDRGVVGHAWSPDLDTWEVREPLSVPNAGFDQFEVCQTVVVDGRPILIFSCLRGQLAAARRPGFGSGGVWWVEAPSLAGPFDPRDAQVLLDDRFYSARLIRDRAGHWQALAFHNTEQDGSFDGRLSDPMPVGWVTPDVFGPL